MTSEIDTLTTFVILGTVIIGVMGLMILSAITDAVYELKKLVGIFGKEDKDTNDG